MRVLVVGAYGHFGRVICEQLKNIRGVEVIAGGRNESKLNAISNQLDIAKVFFDGDDPYMKHTLTDSDIHFVVNATGPYQSLNLGVAKTCLEAGCYYADISDCEDFTTEIRRLDSEARRVGIMMATGLGMSSLNAAIVDHMALNFANIDTIDMGFTGDGKLPGPASIAGSLATCGFPVSHVAEGRFASAIGLREVTKRRFGHDFCVRTMVNGECPEVATLMNHYRPESIRRQVGFGQLGPRVVALLSVMVQANWLYSATSLTKPLIKIGNLLKGFSKGRAALFVDVAGRGIDREPLSSTFELHMKQGACLLQVAPVIALIRKLMGDMIPPSGAYLAAEECLVNLGEIIGVMADSDIQIYQRNNDQSPSRRRNSRESRPARLEPV